jgi:hypothetical protein
LPDFWQVRFLFFTCFMWILFGIIYFGMSEK